MTEEERCVDCICRGNVNLGDEANQLFLCSEVVTPVYWNQRCLCHPSRFQRRKG